MTSTIIDRPAVSESEQIAALLAPGSAFAAAHPHIAGPARALVDELADIDADRQLAARMNRETTSGWLRELDREACDCWDHLVELLTAHD